MNRRAQWILSRTSIAAAVLACAGASSCRWGGDRPFSAIYSQIDENGLIDATTQYIIHVEADRDRFRIVSQGSEVDQIQVYDGKQLTTQRFISEEAEEAEVPTDTTTIRSGDPTKSRPETQTLSPEKARALRFWDVRPSGWSIRGDVVAARRTRLYEFGHKEGSRIIRDQVWTDAATGVMLRMSHSIYVMPSKALMTRTTYVCLQIHYVPKINPVEFTLS